MTIEEIKKWKKHLGWTNTDLANRAKIPVSTVSKILGGTTKNPRQNSIQAMEQALKHALSSLQSSQEFKNAGSSATSYLKEAEYVYGSAAPKEEVKNSQTGSPAPIKDHDDTAPVVNKIPEVHHHPGNYTIDDYLALPDDRRVELIDGQFYDMAAPTGIHQIILFQIWKSIDACIEEHGLSCRVQGAPFDVQLFDDPYTVVQPDVMVFCEKPREVLASRAHSAPDFVAEILSPSTAFRDRTQKLCRYRDAGVKEVWIVSPKDQTILVYRFYAGKEEPEKYTFHDSVPLGISDHRCSVNFSQILKYIL